MVFLPEALISYQKEAEIALQKGAVKDIEFSGSTYQVLVEDPHTQEKIWVFLQLEWSGGLKDAFCSCNETQEFSGCLHLAIAYLALFRDQIYPLHLRFNRSFWNVLCKLYESRLGGDPKIILREQKGNFYCQSVTGKTIFFLEAKNPSTLTEIEKILYKTDQETEETSLKFSNLSPEELALWKEGKPESQLRYDLSFWSDLAKWLMKKQEEGFAYQISFNYSKKGLPNWFLFEFGDVKGGFYISEANLSLVIDSLETVSSPLTVIHAQRGSIERVTYDKKEQILHIVEKKEIKGEKRTKVTPRTDVISINGYQFVPGEGFYAEESHELLKRPILQGIEIPQTLDDHARFLSTLISDCYIYLEPFSLSYSLHFDSKWNLHIEAYLFEPGDLLKGDSWLMEKWAYLNDDGFYPVEGNRFDSIELIVNFGQVSDFVSANRVWFNQQEGFHTHVRSIEYQLNYQVTENNRLTFLRSLTKAQESKVQMQDFGVWVYLEGFGFYSKAAGSFSYLLKPGISLSPEQIPLFIRMNREELALIPKFFSPACPISKTSLKIELLDKGKVKITPEYELIPRFKDKTIRLFDDFIYLDGEGFYELPITLRIPEKFSLPLELEGEELQLFLSYEIETLEKYISSLDPSLIRPKQWQLVTDFIEVAPEYGKGWYRIALTYRTDLGAIPLKELRQSIGKKFPFVFSKAGLIDLREDRFDWLRQLDKGRFEKQKNLVLLTSLEFMRLNAYDPVEFHAAQIGSGRVILEELTQLRTPEYPNFTGLISNLRPYQEIGVKWLWFLYRQQLSGLLCDDMGLGKTHQAMALIASISNLFREYAEGTLHHFLIVCPTSVMYHWQEKLLQYMPGLRVCTFYGSKRSLEAFHENYDILLTSYGILRNEKAILSKVPFELAIFDEIQVAKNQFSRVYEALTLIQAQMKIGLTGTPIENYLRELKSLFDITLPSYLPGEKTFRELFIRPIEKEHNEEKKALLNRLIHPFILRRKKRDVLVDLPEKTEEIAHCNLTTMQQKLYSEVLLRKRHHLIQKLKNEEHAIPYMHIFALLSSLKQICDHPAVYLKSPQDYRQYSSGKWELFLELMREARESGQKVVVFSQYLAMLDIIEFYLQEEEIGYASLRGATTNRKEQINLFNQDKECEVFVGSLQAAGLGIDLTAGSVVIHYDRWWNAARENQATDRVHRIGQTKGVQVFKLSTKGTFEEKIDAMIQRKGKLMEEIVGVDDQHLLKTFSRSELIDLLEIVNPENATEIISDTE